MIEAKKYRESIHRAKYISVPTKQKLIFREEANSKRYLVSGFWILAKLEFGNLEFFFKNDLEFY